MTIRTARAVSEEVRDRLKEFGKAFPFGDNLLLNPEAADEAQIKIVEQIIRKYQKEIIDEVAALDGAGFDDVMYALRMK